VIDYEYFIAVFFIGLACRVYLFLFIMLGFIIISWKKWLLFENFLKLNQKTHRLKNVKISFGILANLLRH
jgi:hypothetical protein